MNSKGRKLQLDYTAESSDPALPAFIARPEGKPVYHGFEIIQESETEGWLYGAITAYESAEEAITEGDGFVIAPDGSRAGVAWATNTADFYQISEPSETRWGVYGVKFPKPVYSKEDLIENFKAVLPLFQKRFQDLQNRHN